MLISILAINRVFFLTVIYFNMVDVVYYKYGSLIGISINLIGLLLYIIYMYNKGPYVIRPIAFGIWITSFGVFYSLQIYYISNVDINDINKYKLRFYGLYFTLFIINIVGFIIFFIGNNIDGGLWSIVSFFYIDIKYQCHMDK